MAPKSARKILDSYTIEATNELVRPGDCVLMRPARPEEPPYVAQLEKIEMVRRQQVKIRVRWYYRPKDTIQGLRTFHGAKEVLLSEHYDEDFAYTLLGKCTVHSLSDYTALDNVGANDYYCRLEYNATTGQLTPESIVVFCTCWMPFNPDEKMLQCEECKERFHPACVELTSEEVMLLDKFCCADCLSNDDAGKSA